MKISNKHYQDFQTHKYTTKINRALQQISLKIKIKNKKPTQLKDGGKGVTQEDGAMPKNANFPPLKQEKQSSGWRYNNNEEIG